MIHRRLFSRYLVLGACLICSVSQAQVRMPALFTDHMVLQREKSLPIWGFAQPGESVTVTFGKQSQTAITDPHGKWRVTLNAMPAGGPFDMTVAGSNTIRITDILIGEVWLCSGQSNMEQGIRFTLGKNWDQLKQMNHPRLRLFLVNKTVANTVQEDVDAQWKACTEKTIMEGGWGGFSAVGYYFGKRLLDELDVPIGLIESSVGGTPIEVWMAQSELEAEPDAKSLLNKWAVKVRQYKPEVAQKRYEQALAKWEEQTQNAKEQGKKAPDKPEAPTPPNLSGWYPSTRYNTMIAPLIPYTMRGINWYQGYANRFDTDAYRSMFHRLIKSWRTAWNEPDMPFNFVQHAPLHVRRTSEKDLLAHLREAQTSALDLPHTAMVVILDVADPRYIHYGNKKPVGERLANLALAQTYGKSDIQPQSPQFDKMTVEGDQAIIHFKYAKDGLTTHENQPVGGFVIAGDDQHFIKATALIMGDTIKVHANEIAKPVAVRYAWANTPEDANVINTQGLPVAPFRTDDWPLK
jgi:sialate O-acetylesterase